MFQTATNRFRILCIEPQAFVYLKAISTCRTNKKNGSRSFNQQDLHGIIGTSKAKVYGNTPHESERNVNKHSGRDKKLL